MKQSRVMKTPFRRLTGKNRSNSLFSVRTTIVLVISITILTAAGIVYLFIPETQTFLSGVVKAVIMLTASQSFIAITMFFLTSSKAVSDILSGKRGKYWAALFMGTLGGLFGVYGTVMSVSIDGIMLGARDIGPIMAGVFGGPISGMIAGMIAGAYRYAMGGVTQIISSIATLLVGTISGVLPFKLREKIHNFKTGLLYGMTIEIFHFLLLLITVQPSSEAFVVVRTVYAPFILLNAVGFGVMLLTLDKIEEKRKLEAEKNRIDAELDLAAKIQSSMLPSIFPPFPDRTEFDIFALIHPAKEVGGDFYDFFMIDENHLAVVIADVSDKGMPAALFAAVGKAFINIYTSSLSRLDRVVNEINRRICETNTASQFITAFVGIIDLNTGLVTYVNAGHEKPFIRIPGGDYEQADLIINPMIGLFDDVDYEMGTIQLLPGSVCFVYTDGVTDAVNTEQKRLGKKGLAGILNKNMDKEPDALLSAVMNAVHEFSNHASQFDDITMLAVKYCGPRTRNRTLDFVPLFESIESVYSFVRSTLIAWNIERSVRNKLNVAVDEILSNIVKYSGATAASFHCEMDDGMIKLCFSDNGTPFDPVSALSADPVLLMDDIKIGGLGISIVKDSMDVFEYEYKDGKNIIIFGCQV